MRDEYASSWRRRNSSDLRQTLDPTELRCEGLTDPKPRSHHPFAPVPSRTWPGPIIFRASAPAHRSAPASVRCFVLTISDTRTLPPMPAARHRRLLTSGGHDRRPNDRARRPGAATQRGPNHVAATDVIITTGGTGITARDSTYEAIAALLEKRPTGSVSCSDAQLRRDARWRCWQGRAGTIGRTAVFSLPTEHAVAWRSRS